MKDNNEKALKNIYEIIVMLILILTFVQCSEEESDTLPPTVSILKPVDQSMIAVPGDFEIQLQMEDDFNLSSYNVFLKQDFQSYIYRPVSAIFLELSQNFAVSSKSQSPVENIELPSAVAGPYKFWGEVRDVFENVGYSDTVTVWLTNTTQSIIEVTNLNAQGQLVADKGSQLVVKGTIGDPINFNDDGFSDFKVVLIGAQTGVIYSKIIDLGGPAILISLGDFIDHPDYGGGITIPQSIADQTLTLSIFVIDIQNNLTFEKIEVLVQ